MDVGNTATAPDFDTVKIEPERDFCQGCLSADRLLSPINENMDLFMYLLGDQPKIESELILCWECMAILKKIQSFRNRVHYAQMMLQQGLYQQNEINTLSTISRIKLESLVLIDNETSPIHNELDASQNIQTVEIPPLTTEIPQEMTPLVTTDNDVKNDDKDIEIKEEDVTDYDIPLEDEVYEETIKEEVQDINEKKDKKIRRKHHEGFKKIMKRYKNPNVDLDKYESCFVKGLLSVKEIEDMGKTVSGTVTKNNKLVCRKCMKLFKQKSELNRHNTFCHILKESEGPFTCLECKAKCPDRASLEAHWSEHNTTYRCKECGWHTCKLWTMKQHAETHTYVWHCKLCPGIVVRTRRDFIYHYQTIHKQAICDYCGKHCESKPAVLKHIQFGHIPPECKICKYTFKNTSRLNRHYTLTHPELVNKKTPKELAYCVECDKQYASEAKYKLHLNTAVAHNPKVRDQWNKKIPCPDCGKIFTRKSYMNNHYKLMHKKETKHYCALCDKYLVSAWSKKLHVQRVHQKIREPKTKICDICYRAFVSNATLTRHRRTHTGERPYLCPHCPAAFTQRTPLVTHARKQHRAQV